MGKTETTSLGFDRIARPKPLHEVAYESLKTGILSGRLALGESYSELELARELGISRTPVREALLKLSAENLVSFNRRKGISVKYFSRKDLEDLSELRQIIEEAAVAKTVGNLAKDQIRSLKSLIAEQEACIKENYDENHFLEIDRRFHLSLIEACGNRFMIQTYNNIRDHFAITFRGALAKKGRASEVLREHKSIVTALAQGNAEMAREAVRDHLMNSKSTALDYYSGYVEE
jgi:DNA-binding GntR family transcriptional regulator